MFGVAASKRDDNGEGWEWHSSEPERAGLRRPRLSAPRVLVALALASAAWPAVAARRWDDPSLIPAQTLYGWSKTAPAAPGPSTMLVELAQKEGGAVVPPVKRQPPQMPSAKEAAPAAEPAPAAAPAEKPKAPSAGVAAPAPTPDTSWRWTDVSSIFSPVTDWLAKANREYQGTVVKELSKPSPQEMEAQAKQQEAEKAAQAEAARKAEAAAQQAAAEEAARKKAEADAAARKAAEAAAKEAEAQKQSEAKKQTEAAKQAEAVKQAEAAKAAEASKEAEARKQAEAKQAEALKAAEVAKQAEQKKAADAEAEARRQREAAKLAEEKKLADEKRQAQLAQEQARKEQAEAERKAHEAKLAEERKAKDEARARADAARTEAARADAQRTQQAATAKQGPVAAATTPASNQRHRRWTVTIIPEPIERPSAQPVEGRQLDLPRVREANAVMLGSRQLSGRMSLGGGSLKGPAVKRWVWRAGTCRFAGRKVSRKVRYTVAQGDSLWRISEKYYDEGGKYPRIYRANRDRIADPSLIYPCQKFRVPRQ